VKLILIFAWENPTREKDKHRCALVADSTTGMHFIGLPPSV